MGARAAAAWTAQLGLDVNGTPHWYVEIGLPTDTADTQLDLNIYPEEWGIVFRRGNRVSSIRVTDVAFVHGKDDHGLLTGFPELARFDELLATLERRYDLVFQRTQPAVRSNLRRAVAGVRAWLIGSR